MADDSNITTVNSTLHGIISQLDIFLNNVNVAQNVGNNYPYKAYIDYLLTKSSDFLDHAATSCGWYTDNMSFKEAGVLSAGINRAASKGL